MISTETSSSPGTEPSEKARNRKANQLVSGKMSRIASGIVFWRASTILKHQTMYATRLRPGIRKATNHQGDIEAARSNGNAWTNGTNTQSLGLLPVFWQIN